MAAATQSTPLQFNQNGRPVFRVSLSVMTSGQAETLSYNYASLPAAIPVNATMRIQTAPTALCGLFMACSLAAADPVAKTVPVRIYTEAGGDITGAVVDVQLEFLSAGATTAGITPV